MREDDLPLTDWESLSRDDVRESACCALSARLYVWLCTCSRARSFLCLRATKVLDDRGWRSETHLLCLRSRSCERLCRLSIWTRASCRSEVTRRQWRFSSTAPRLDCSSCACSAATCRADSFAVRGGAAAPPNPHPRPRTPHLGVQLLPAPSLRLQFLLRLLQPPADELHLRLAAVQLHGQLAS